MMTSGSNTHAPGSIKDYFKFESKVGSTRTADLHRAVDRKTGILVSVWTLRHPLSNNSPAVERFLKRLETLQACGPGVCKILSYGVDEAGVAFAALPFLDGHPISNTRLDSKESERRFMACLRKIEVLHLQSVVCGDLCDGSFWITRDGDIEFVGIMGSFDTEAAATSVMPPLSTLQFVSPEQRSGGGADQLSDVFALGVLGYLLISGITPGSEGKLSVAGIDVTKVRPLATITTDPPVWADSVLMKALGPQPSHRYASAGGMLRAILEYTADQRETGSDLIDLSSKERTRPSQESSTYEPKQDAYSSETPQKERNEKETFFRGKSRILIPIGLGLLSFVIVLIDRKYRQDPKPVAELAAHRDAVNSEVMKEGIDIFRQQAVSAREKEGYLQKFVDSDDPLSHDVLVQGARTASAEGDRVLAEQAIIRRLRRLKFGMAADQADAWLSSLRGQPRPPAYEFALKSLNTALPPEAQLDNLRNLLQANPRIALRILCALAVEASTPDQYQPLLVELLGNSLQLADASAHGALALVLYHPEVGSLFQDKIIARHSEISNNDILWLVGMLSLAQDARLQAVTTIAMDRKLFSPIRMLYLSQISSRTDVSAEVGVALSNAASGNLKPEDIQAIGGWDDTQGEKILLAICAEAQTPEILMQAFEALATKSLTVPASRSLLEWVKSNAWANRKDFAKLVGMLAYQKEVGWESFEKEMQVLDAYSDRSPLLHIFMEQENPQVVQYIIRHYASKLGFGDLLQLLSNPQQDVRVAAVESLKGYNDVMALRMIVDSYDKEKDPAVREIYKKNFWMIREREAEK